MPPLPFSVPRLAIAILSSTRFGPEIGSDGKSYPKVVGSISLVDSFYASFYLMTSGASRHGDRVGFGPVPPEWVGAENWQYTIPLICGIDAR